MKGVVSLKALGNLDVLRVEELFIQLETCSLSQRDRNHNTSLEVKRLTYCFCELEESHAVWVGKEANGQKLMDREDCYG